MNHFFVGVIDGLLAMTNLVGGVGYRNLNLGLVTKVRACKMQANNEAHESHFIFLGV
jgi:hypothetical protein